MVNIARKTLTKLCRNHEYYDIHMRTGFATTIWFAFLITFNNLEIASSAINQKVIRDQSMLENRQNVQFDPDGRIYGNWENPTNSIQTHNIMTDSHYIKSKKTGSIHNPKLSRIFPEVLSKRVKSNRDRIQNAAPLEEVHGRKTANKAENYDEVKLKKNDEIKHSPERPVKTNINITVETSSYKIELPSTTTERFYPTVPPISEYSASLCPMNNTSTPVNLTVNVASAAAAAGPPGRSGAPGIPGLPGVKGEKGESGPMGKKGDEGKAGARGSEGLKGKHGSPGKQGQKGENGQIGESGQLRSQAAMSAILTKHFGPTKEAIVPFNMVLIDTGDNYDNDTGVFICTMPGVYVVSVYLMSHPGSKVNARVYINNRPVAAMWADDNKSAGFYPSASIQAISRLEFGDQVYVKLVDKGYGNSWVHANYNMFTVFLLYEEIF